MKKALLRSLSILFFALGLATAYGQHNCNLPQQQKFLNGNNIRALILTGGDLFWNGDDARFQVPYQPNGPSAIYAQGLWLGGINPGGNLKLAAQTYGRGRNQADYWPGPLDEAGATDVDACTNWDRVFSVLRYQVEAHISDFEDNGVVDNPIPEILGWPAQGNPYFSDVYGFELPDTPQGLAPFADKDGDGKYDPLAGDYPMIRNSAVIPSQIAWVVFNDNGNIHFDSHGDPLAVEVQLTSWAFDCSDNAQLNNTLFTSFKVINRSAQSLDSLYLGLWTDFDLGCYTDDFIGTAPALNTVFTYNKDNEDGPNCPQGVASYGTNPPAQALTVLNRELSYSMFYNNSGIGGPLGTTEPNQPEAYYNLLTGRWPDGTPLTFGGNGYDPSGANPLTNYVFPDDPNDPAGWSELNQSPDEQDRRTVSSVGLGALQPGAVAVVDFALSYFREDGADYLENVTAMYEGIPLLKNWYDNQFEAACSPPSCEDDCVWAGDLNADGIANHCDLLALGVGLDESGPVRPAPYNWSPRNGEAWAGQQGNGANEKHLDADGNGQAAYEDFFLSEEHYNLTHSGYQPPAPEYREGPELWLEAADSVDLGNLSPGQSPIFITIDLTEDLPDLYGLAFSLEYDTAYIESIFALQAGYRLASRTFQTGSGGSALAGQFDFAKVAVESIGQGRLSLLQIKVKDDFLYPLPADSTLIRFKNIKAIRSDGTEIEIGGTTVAARFPGIVVTGTEDPSDGAPVRIFPNPTNGRLELRFPGQQIDGVALFTATGQLAWRQRQRFTDSASLNLGQLPEGLYFLQVQQGAQRIVRKVVLR